VDENDVKIVDVVENNGRTLVEDFIPQYNVFAHIYKCVKCGKTSELIGSSNTVHKLRLTSPCCYKKELLIRTEKVLNPTWEQIAKVYS